MSATNKQPQIKRTTAESYTVPLLSRRPSVLLSCCPHVWRDWHVETDKKKDNIGSREGGVDANWEDGVFLSESCIVKLFLPFLLDVTKIQWTSAYGETSSVSSDTAERSWGVTSEQTGEPPWNLLGWRRD